jgi:hypothetical protein
MEIQNKASAVDLISDGLHGEEDIEAKEVLPIIQT